MKRVLVIVMAMLLVAPGVVTAQATPEASPKLGDLVPTTADLGISWMMTEEFDGIHPDLGLNRVARTFAGPQGARLTVILYEMSDRFSDQAREWTELQSFWQAWANYYRNAFETDATRVDVTPRWPTTHELPEGASDAISYYEPENPIWAMPVGVSLFILEHGFALFVIVDGSINEEWGTPATVTIAEEIIRRVEGVHR